ncbi:hypothetical protein [Actinomadura sp. 9N407]|uniref:hypothetical protein n=1 Tax=Actinomadura sp. 9N407 TaxID=3375154 RepID=UPI003787EC58
MVERRQKTQNIPAPTKEKDDANSAAVTQPFSWSPFSTPPVDVALGLEGIDEIPCFDFSSHLSYCTYAGFGALAGT